MRTVYLKNQTVINILRTVKNSESRQSFQTTVADAIKNNDFDTCRGTVDVQAWTDSGSRVRLKNGRPAAAIPENWE